MPLLQMLTIYLVYIFPLGVLVPDAQSYGIIPVSIQKVEPASTRNGYHVII